MLYLEAREFVWLILSHLSLIPEPVLDLVIYVLECMLATFSYSSLEKTNNICKTSCCRKKIDILNNEMHTHRILDMFPVEQ